jgi:serine/threonine protein kinase
VPYLAPEQLQGHPRPASDQYAFGVGVYEWLCGRLPFHGSSIEIATQHLLASPPPLDEYVPDLSPWKRFVLASVVTLLQPLVSTLRLFQRKDVVKVSRELLSVNQTGQFS